MRGIALEVNEGSDSPKGNRNTEAIRRDMSTDAARETQTLLNLMVTTDSIWPVTAFVQR